MTKTIIVRYLFVSKIYRICTQLIALLCFLGCSIAFGQGVVVDGEYIVKFKVNQAASGKISSAQGNKLASEKGQSIIASMKGVNIRQKFTEAGMLHIGSVTAAKLAYLKTNPDVEYIEPNYVLSLDPTSKDPNSQVNAESLGANASPSDSYSQSYAQVHVTDSWALEKAPNAASKTVVAVVDTGLDIHHAVFVNSNAIWKNPAEVNGITGIDDDNNGYVDDYNGWNFIDNSSSMYDDAEHGTHVSGIILGVGQDIMQIPVRESKVVIMPLKFLDGSGSGSTSNAISAIYYAVNNGAKVINNSWGGSSYSRSLQDAYKYAYDHNVVLVTAAGNSNVNLDTSPMYPAALDAPSNITVAASTSSDNRASFSNYSRTLAHVFAPGTSIMSTIPGTQCSDPNNLFYYCLASLSGTSMASPFVAGLAALAIREAPNLSAYQIKGLIMSSIDSAVNLANLVESNGRVNALTTIQMAKAQISTSSFLPVYSPVYKADASSRDPASDSGGGKAGGCGLVKAAVDEMGGPSAGGKLGQLLMISVLVLAPALLAVKLRNKQTVRPYVRQYERYNIEKELMIQMGDQVISSASQSLSEGGLSFKTDANFAKGQKVKVKISEVSEEIEGEIVWQSDKNSFGIKFLTVTEGLKQQMQVWSAGLNPA